jgi:hypothetical protein
MCLDSCGTAPQNASLFSALARGFTPSHCGLTLAQQLRTATQWSRPHCPIPTRMQRHYQASIHGFTQCLDLASKSQQHLKVFDIHRNANS